MEKEVLEKYKKAKSISLKIREFSKALIKEGAKAVEVADKIENKIKELDGKLAFPVNVSINENAAHYAPDINDPLTFNVDDLVKIDIGVHVDGYIWDAAFTICVGKKTHPLIEASETALKESLKIIKPGIKIFEISNAVEDTITEFGFKPVRNLCGHGLERYNQHAHPSIPNGKNTIEEEIKPGQVIAMEVFATDGSGMIKESFPVLIYKYRQEKPVRLWEARKILELARTEFEKLPFARRWLKDLTTEVKIDLALKQLTESGALTRFPVLKEESDGKVAQTEETVIVK